MKRIYLILNSFERNWSLLHNSIRNKLMNLEIFPDFRHKTIKPNSKKYRNQIITKYL